jgi:hypothetical protein
MPGVPWHFLYNLALKHLSDRQRSISVTADWKNLIELSQDFAASFDVEQYSSIEEFGIAPALLQDALLEKVFYDELFSFQQWSAETGESVFGRWIVSLEEADCFIPLDSPTHWKAISNAIFHASSPDQIRVVRRSNFLVPGISNNEIGKFLRALSVSARRANRDYQNPQDTDKRNAPQFPIVEIEHDQYFLPPRGLAMRALYERLFELLPVRLTPA